MKGRTDLMSIRKYCRSYARKPLIFHDSMEKHGENDDKALMSSNKALRFSIPKFGCIANMKGTTEEKVIPLENV